MLKSIGVLSLFGVCIVAAIGLAGGGEPWFRYVGSGMLIILLLSILSHVAALIKRVETLTALIKLSQGDALAVHEALHRSQQEETEDAKRHLN